MLQALLASPYAAPLFAGLAIFLLVLAIGLAVADGIGRRARIAAATGTVRRERLRELQGRGASGRWQKDALRLMRASVGKLTVVRNKQANSVRLKLMQAGYRNRDALIVYVFGKALMPIVGAGATAFVVFVAWPLHYPMLVLLGIVIGGALLGSMTPDIVLKNLRDRRKNEIQAALPDALDLLLICAESGLSVDSGIARVANEIGRTSPALADELTYTALEIRFLPERRRAIQGLAERADHPGIRALTSTLIQTERYGTPLGQALRVLSTEQRNERMMRAEEKASRLPAIMTVPLILFILPALFVVLLGPAALSIIDALGGRH
jgi:tight adherence protein C